MERSSHYYAFLALCRLCGMNKKTALEVAYASQFVDDSIVDVLTFTNNPVDVQYSVINGRNTFTDASSCHSYFKIKTLNYQSMTRNTVAFHFLPGCEGSSFTRKLRCKRESPIILELIEKTMKERDPIRLGMVLHAYADTFSHHGFTGIISRENDIRRVRPHSPVWLTPKEWFLFFLSFFFRSRDRFFDHILPAYGHVQGISFPDIAHARWSYEYEDTSCGIRSMKKTERIDNRARYREAFEKTRDIILKYLDKYPKFRDGENRAVDLTDFNNVLHKPTSEGRKERLWRKYMIKQGLYDRRDSALFYDNKIWYKRAFPNITGKQCSMRMVQGLRCAEDLNKTEWYRFYSGVQWYTKLFFKTAKKLGVFIPL